MAMGIAIMGMNGSGKSTLAHAWAKRTGAFEMDVEDYYFPQQREARRQALEGEIPAITDDEIPFSRSETKEEVQAALLRDMQAHPDFVLAGVTMNWSEEILACIDAAFWVQTPLQVRMERIRRREEMRFGDRVRPGGDMYEQQKEFREMVQGRDEGIVGESAGRLHCPVILLDGTKTIEENLQKMREIVTGLCLSGGKK